MNYPKNYILLLFGFGVSNLGNWIYLIALNLAVWHLTHSPAAVAGIYVVGPIARILCSFFAGSIIDRSNKKQILIWTDIFRGIIVCIILLCLWRCCFEYSKYTDKRAGKRLSITRFPISLFIL